MTENDLPNDDPQALKDRIAELEAKVQQLEDREKRNRETAAKRRSFLGMLTLKAIASSGVVEQFKVSA